MTYRAVVYVLGNHQHYGGSSPHLNEKADEATQNGNVHPLDATPSYSGGGRGFLGTSL